MPRLNNGFVIAGLVILASLPASGQLDFGKKSPTSTVLLLSSVEAVVPARPFDVALNFKPPPGWHTYWRNAGESGLPPEVKWSLPGGFTAGDLQFPVPKRFRNQAGIVTNILDGEPLLPVRITPPDTVSAETVTLAANIQYLICATQCIRQTADVRLDLPVRPAGTEPGTANEELFQRAGAALPKTDSKYLSVAAAVEPAVVSTGKSFNLLLNVDVAPGFRIRSPEPPDSVLSKSGVFLEPAHGVSFGQPVYPPGQVRTVESVGEVSEYVGRVTIRVPGRVEPEAPAGPLRLGGILAYQVSDESGTALPQDAIAFSLVTAGESDAASGYGWLQQYGTLGLFVAMFLYGLFINATPCVLPLLSIKVLGFVQQAHESRRRTLVLGLAFGAGVIVFFVVLGLIAGAGRNVLQYPSVVIGLGTVVMALALSMLGVYTLQVPTAATKLEASIHREGPIASFGKGALAPVLGFACTGPLLAGAFGVATQQPPLIAVSAFLFAGLGMAGPYMLLGANPNWLSFLPKPGPWMVAFERIMGFILLAMVVWLLDPLVAQIGPEGLQWTLVFLVAVATGCGLLGKIDFSMSAWRRWWYRVTAAVIVIAAAALIYGWIYPLGEAQGAPAPSLITWVPWSEEAVEAETRAGKVVFVDVTAAWCTVCKANKKLAVNTPQFREKLEALGAVAFQADFTSPDPKIAALLHKHDRLGPPLNLVYRPGDPDRPIVLHPNLTKNYLLQKLDEAAAWRSASPSTPGS